MTDDIDLDGREQIFDRRAPGNTLERHASTIGIAIIIGLLLWVGNSIISQSAKQGEMSGDIRVMAKEISYLNSMITSATANNYTNADANRDNAECDRRFKVVEKRVDHLEDLSNGHK